jgi:hypothetical protein
MSKQKFLASIAAVAIVAPALSAGIAAANPSSSAHRSFTSISIDLRNTTMRPERTLTIHANGDFDYVLRGGVGTPIAPIHGRANPAEILAVRSAFVHANVATLPGLIPNPAMIMGGTTIELVSKVGAATYKTDATMGFYASYENRLQPLVDALLAIERRITNAPALPPPAPATKDLGTLPQPGDTLATKTVELAPGQTLRWADRENQIRGVGQITISPAGALQVQQKQLEPMQPGVLGSTSLEEYRITVPATAKVGDVYTVTTSGNWQVRNNNGWAFSFKVKVVTRAAATSTPGLTGSLSHP